MSTNAKQVPVEIQAAETYLKSYEVMSVDEESGEEIVQSVVKYLEGQPREYRFNGQTGGFSLYGVKPLLDDMQKSIPEFSFQPVAYRIFQDQLFSDTEPKVYVEFFFLDEEKCMSHILFGGVTTVAEIMRMNGPIFYDGKKLTDMMLTVRPEKVTSKKNPEKSWYIGRFSYRLAKPSDTLTMARDFVKDHHIYRADTITPNGETREASKYFASLPAIQERLLLLSPDEHEEPGECTPKS